MKIQSIFFDFDGVIADSVGVKTDAFFQMYSGFGKEIAEKVVSHHLANGGMSRFDKFKFYHGNFLHIDLTQNQINDLASQFSKIVKDKVVRSAEIPGVRDFLQRHHKSMNFWIVSGTPTDEIRAIVAEKNLKSFFYECYGSPEKKEHWVSFLINRHSLDKRECLFVGDAMCDCFAAQKNDIGFVLRETEENRQLFQELEVSRIKDFLEFESLLEEWT